MESEILEVDFSERIISKDECHIILKVMDLPILGKLWKKNYTKCRVVFNCVESNVMITLVLHCFTLKPKPIMCFTAFGASYLYFL